MKTILIIIWISFICFYSYGQINIGGKPYSFQNQIKAKNIIKNETPKIEVAKLDFDKLKEEDRLNDSTGKPFRYGKAINVAYDWNNSGEWIELENGDRIWKLEIYCPLAKSINLTYDKFWLPDGGLLYLYDKDKTTIIGGLNKRNNRGTKENPSKYATGLIFSDEIALEYYEPKEVRGEGIISMSNVIYGYTDISSLLADLCTVNINCSPEGDNWQDEKKSVALVIAKVGTVNYSQFTGSLMNNTRGDGTPYFLTANHCLDGTNIDAISNPDASDFLFYWNYECSSCDYSSCPPSYSAYPTVGATVVANDSPSDFALFRLIESPYDLSPQIQAYYNGWDRQTPYYGNLCIHHPSFQPKKISIDENTPTTALNYFWKVMWDETSSGISNTYPGSSGSPLYSSNSSRVIGQLNGSQGGECQDQQQTANFGKISISWDHGTEARRRLRDWLDPDNSGVNYLDGTYCTGTRNLTNITYNVDNVIYGCSIVMQNVYVSNGANVTFNAANDVVINGTFEVALGSTIEVK